MSEANTSVAGGSEIVRHRGLLWLVLLGLFLSGAAGVANQVLWQRALKIFLGGIDTISSLVVVLVFMLGLGLGAGLTATRAWKARHPVRLLAFIELALFAVNAAVAWLLHVDPVGTVLAVEKFAVALGVPLLLVYVVGAVLILLLPTTLMGATLPIASEACQRQLGATQSRLITVLFFLNTLGAVVGAIGSSFFLSPVYGQTVSLSTAALCNLGAAILLFVVASRLPAVASGDPPRAVTASIVRGIRLEEWLGLCLGFLSLGYEIYLFRVGALAHGPMPYTFATTLCLYLLFWSVGMFASAHLGNRPRIALAIAAVATLAMPSLYAIDRWESHFALLGGVLLYFIPCLSFGFLYGNLVTRSATHWGNDVGRFSAMNTLGSCLGIVFFTLVGYEFDQDWNAFLIATGLVALLVVLTSCDLQSVLYKRLLAAAQLALIAFGIGLVAVGLARPYTLRGDTKTFWGRDGVVEVDERGQVRIDGLWHSVLSDGKSHVGEVYSWMMAFVGVFSRADQPMTDAMVVGNGVGLTATTLSRVNGLKVDTYEINHTFKRVLANFPEGTLEVATNPQINIMWRDARTGMALDPKSYDIIISAPLYLTQAGSSLLLSREYLTLAKSRLKPGGVFVMYSHEGVPEQALLIQHTVRKVFLHARTFFQGLVTVASDAPIEITEESIAARLERPDPFYREAAAVNRILEGRGTALHRMIDPIEELIPTRYLVTDDHPLVEYPDVAARLMRRERLSAGAGSPQRPLAGR